MQRTVELDDNDCDLAELLGLLKVAEDGVVLTRGGTPVAQVLPPVTQEMKWAAECRRRALGSYRDKIRILAEDDEHLRGFEGYPP